MAKTVIGQRSDSMTARSILRTLPESAINAMDTSVEGNVYIAEAFIAYHSREEKYRPYLQLQGHINSISGDMGDIQRIIFNDDDTIINPRLAPQVSFEYELSNDELADLSKKGLFDSDFEVPDLFQGTILQLPLDCRINHIQPITESDSPILFVDVKNQFNISTNALASGYADETEYNNGKVIGLSAYFAEKEVIPESEFSNDDDFLDYDEDYETGIRAPEDESEIQMVPVEEVEMSEEDIKLLKMYAEIQEKTDERVAQMESDKKQRESETQSNVVHEIKKPHWEHDYAKHDSEMITADDDSDESYFDNNSVPSAVILPNLVSYDVKKESEQQVDTSIAQQVESQEEDFFDDSTYMIMDEEQLEPDFSKPDVELLSDVKPNKVSSNRAAPDAISQMKSEQQNESLEME